APNRIEAYVVDHSEATMAAVEKVIVNFFDALPHTPIRAIGCNFQFQDSEPSAEIIGVFDTPEAIEGQYQVISRQSTVQIQLDECVLNFSRSLTGDQVSFRFNYHKAVESAEKC